MSVEWTWWSRGVDLFLALFLVFVFLSFVWYCRIDVDS